MTRQSETVTLAKSLLGQRLIAIDDNNEVSAGIIVETEAYLGFIDEACHSYKHKYTPRLKSLYSEINTVYIYSMHRQLLLNIISKPSEAVLIRAIQPIVNLEAMNLRRDKAGIQISNGPGKLSQALGIRKDMNGTKLGDIISVEQHNDIENLQICESPRIGIDNKGEWTHKNLRFYIKENPYVSKTKRTASIK